MKNLAVCFLALLSLVTIGVVTVSAEHKAEHTGGQNAAIKVEEPAKCTICGMDRRKFAHSRALVTFDDGSTVGTCSISCAREAVDKSTGKRVKLIQVADYGAKQLMDAKTSVWVIGGSKRGVMTSTAKWAFAERSGAETFVKEFGGKVTEFDEVWKSAD